MKTHIYKTETDLIYPCQLLHKYSDIPQGVIDSLKNDTPMPDGFFLLTNEESKTHMGNTPPPEGKRRKKHCYPFEFEDIPPPTTDQLVQQAQSEMITELNWVDLQLKYHATGDTKRAISTVELINAYAVDCRDYVQNVDSVLTIVGDKPSRPE